MSWYDEARNVIATIDATLPRDTSLAQRRAAVRSAYPWGPRENHPYKSWCKAQREYLARFENRPLTDGLFETTK